jgi:hypothetical protein
MQNQDVRGFFLRNGFDFRQILALWQDLGTRAEPRTSGVNGQVTPACDNRKGAATTRGPFAGKLAAGISQSGGQVAVGVDDVVLQDPHSAVDGFLLGIAHVHHVGRELLHGSHGVV